MTEPTYKYHMKLRVFSNEPYFGPGVSALMSYVKETGSLSAACKEMGMAYSKAWKIIKKAEQDLGITLMEGQRGGRQGGKTLLTKDGEEFLKAYLGFVKESQEAVDRIYHKYF